MIRVHPLVPTRFGHAIDCDLFFLFYFIDFYVARRLWFDHPRFSLLWFSGCCRRSSLACGGVPLDSSHTAGDSRVAQGGRYSRCTTHNPPPSACPVPVEACRLQPSEKPPLYDGQVFLHIRYGRITSFAAILNNRASLPASHHTQPKASALFSTTDTFVTAVCY